VLASCVYPTEYQVVTTISTRHFSFIALFLHFNVYSVLYVSVF